MAQERASVAIVRGLFQMFSGPIKRRLDRRYLTRDEATLTFAVIHERLSDARQSIRDQGVALTDANRRIARADSRLADVSASLGDVSASLHASTQRLSDLDRELNARISDVRSEAAIGAAFVSREEPHELRKKLFDAHRLARESAEAIESLLQAELELWQAIDAVDAHPSTSGPADV